MTYEVRPNGVTQKGNPYTVRGSLLKVGDTAPDFTVITPTGDPRTLVNYAGKIKIISSVASLSGRICNAQTRQFNQEAANLSENIVVLTVSSDTPDEQQNWCEAAGIDRVEVLSCSADMRFSDDYGVHIVDLGMNQRSIFVLDSNNKVVYVEYVPEIAMEANLDAALAAAQLALTL
ncbi:MAG: thiol peroxidase [Chloroflexi bacterium]|nr:thiol peroxidase [Chloroflexota bacterium]